MRVDLETERLLDVLRQTLLVALLDSSPLLLERRVFGKLEQALELREILEEGRLREVEGLLDEIAEAGVALVEPAAGGD